VRGTLIPRCKHWIAEEQPQRLAAVLLDFFAATAVEPGAGPHVQDKDQSAAERTSRPSAPMLAS
jgi:hypothetical protein